MVRKKCWQEVGELKCFLEAQLEIKADAVVVRFQWPCRGKDPPDLLDSKTMRARTIPDATSL